MISIRSGEVTSKDLRLHSNESLADNSLLPVQLVNKALTELTQISHWSEEVVILDLFECPTEGIKVEGACSNFPAELSVLWDRWHQLNMRDSRPPSHSNGSRLEVTSRPA
jgi:hypothetical protein